MPLAPTVVNGKILKKKLVIELSEGEDIHTCIRSAMENNNVKKAGIISIKGEMQKAVFNYFLGNSFKSKTLENILIQNSSGHFELSKKTGLFGNIKILVREMNKTNTYTLVKGSAKEGLIIEMEFFELI